MEAKWKVERGKGGRVEGKKVERWKVGKVERCQVERWKGGRWKGRNVERCISIIYCSISNIRIQQRLLANYVPGVTHNLQRSTRYQFSSVGYYILSYGQKYISEYDFNHLSNMTQK